MGAVSGWITHLLTPTGLTSPSPLSLSPFSHRNPTPRAGFYALIQLIHALPVNQKTGLCQNRTWAPLEAAWESDPELEYRVGKDGIQGKESMFSVPTRGARPPGRQIRNIGWEGKPLRISKGVSMVTAETTSRAAHESSHRCTVNKWDLPAPASK